MDIKELFVGKDGALCDVYCNKIEAKSFGQPIIRSIRAGKTIFPAWIIAGAPATEPDSRIEIVGYVLGTAFCMDDRTVWPVQFYADYSKMPVYIPYDFCTQPQEEKGE